MECQLEELIMYILLQLILFICKTFIVAWPPKLYIHYSIHKFVNSWKNISATFRNFNLQSSLLRNMAFYFLK